MRELRASIRGRLSLWLYCAAVSAVALLCGVMVWADHGAEAERAMTKARAAASLLASQSAAALIFEDSAAAAAAAGALLEDPSIASAAIYGMAGQTLARKSNPELAEPATETSEDVIWSGEKVGTVRVAAAGPRLSSMIRLRALPGLLALLGSALICALLAAMLHGALTYPLVDLATTAAFIRRERDYSIRLPHSLGGELGRAIDAFNELMTDIQAREKDYDRRQRFLERQMSALETQARTTARPSTPDPPLAEPAPDPSVVPTELAPLAFETPEATAPEPTTGDVASAAVVESADSRDAASDADTTIDDASGVLPSADLSGLRVLLATDEAPEPVLELLEDWGAELDVVDNASEAVDLCARGGFDAVVADSSFVTWDGVSLPARLLAQYPEIPAVIVVDEGEQARVHIPGVEQISRSADVLTLAEAILSVAGRMPEHEPIAAVVS